MIRKTAGLMVIALAVLGFLIFPKASLAEPPQVVESVDLSRYMGQWYEIASIPMFFQRKCAGNTTAQYTLLENGRVQVINSCQTAEGRRIQARGRAQVEDEQTNAKLRVTFVNFWGRWWYLFGGDYWITLLADDYAYAIVGHPDREYGWILSRTPSLPPETLRKLALELRAQGYDPCNFITTPQPGGLNRQMPLCEVLQ